MLYGMSILLGATTAVALSASAALADPQDQHDRGNNPPAAVAIDGGQAGYGNGYNYGYDDGYARRGRDAHYRSDMYRTQPAGVLSVNLGGIAFGYRDGYWDNGHTWHNWRRSGDYRKYRDQSGSNYHNWRHDRDGNDGWQR
jgi:opacity protein-like surface antigen